MYITKYPAKSVGLGLSLVYKIIQNYKGEIKYTSELDKGTNVFIKLPVKN